jgi:glutamate N-acetyltransferase/amino-acid N-acetyltransferase
VLPILGISSSSEFQLLMTEKETTLPAGFQYAGVACGIKPSGKPDMSLIVADGDVVCAGVFTTNQIVAAPVLLCKARTPSAKIRAVITNSGNANACTGQQGMDDAVEMCRQVAGQLGCDESQVLVMSTGVIGHTLPMDEVRQGIDDANQQLGASSEAFVDSSEAILTTDNARKTVQRQVKCGGQTYAVAAMAKGAGMISPNMATMLAVVMTDAPLQESDSQQLLSRAADLSFNRVSVDGHTSTNDTLLLLSSGKGKPLSGKMLGSFSEQLNQLCIDLAKKLVADGEGATHVMQIRVHGAESNADAETIARTVAASPLVKTAITGGDPNWGRIVSAAGYAAAKINPAKTTLKVCGQAIYLEGVPEEFDAAALSKEMKASDEVAIDLQVGDDSGEATFWSSDLTTEYVTFNSEYTT